MSGDIVEFGEKTLGHAAQHLRGDDLRGMRTGSPEVSCLCATTVETGTYIVGHPERHLRVVVIGRQETELVVIHLTQVVAVCIGVIERRLGT
jgi:hypothetical protein